MTALGAFSTPEPQRAAVGVVRAEGTSAPGALSSGRATRGGSYTPGHATHQPDSRRMTRTGAAPEHIETKGQP